MSNIYDKSSLVLIPSGTKSGKVFSQKPVSGDGDFTFTRSSAATRVNADGNIEKETQNFLIQSDWDDVGTGVAPTGWSTADPDFEAGASAGQIRFNPTSDRGYIYQSYSIGTGVYSLSVYVDSVTTANNIDGILAIFGSVSQSHILWSKDGETISGGTAIEAGHRYTKVFNVTTGGSAILRIGAGVNGNTTADFTLSRPQLEQGLVARDYIETTTSAVEGGITDNVPRLDYTDSSCPALLLEPQRTNYCPYSEYQSGSGFSLGANITWNGFVESPEGLNNASKFTSSTTSASYVQVQNVTIPAGDFTFSMWVRGVSGSFVNRQMYIPSHTGTQATMNEAPVAGEDWKLVYGSGTNTSGSSYVRTITLPFYDQPANAVWEMYGFQLEAGSYATSYIPTYGSSVTRNGDNYLLDNMVTNGITNDSAISIFVDAKAPLDTTNTYIDLFALKLTSGDNLRIESRTNDRFYVQCSSGFVNSGDSPNTYSNASFAPSVGRAKILFTMTSAQIKLYYNGSLLETWNGSYNIDFNQFMSDVTQATTQLKNNLNQALIMSSALTDQEAIDLTTI